VETQFSFWGFFTSYHNNRLAKKSKGKKNSEFFMTRKLKVRKKAFFSD
jgi:hypothetical protein